MRNSTIDWDLSEDEILVKRLARAKNSIKVIKRMEERYFEENSRCCKRTLKLDFSGLLSYCEERSKHILHFLLINACRCGHGLKIRDIGDISFELYCIYGANCQLRFSIFWQMVFYILLFSSCFIANSFCSFAIFLTQSFLFESLIAKS